MKLDMPHTIIVVVNINHKGHAVGVRSLVSYTVEPLYKGQDGGIQALYSGASLLWTRWGLAGLIQWSLSTRDKMGASRPYTVEPLYNGQDGGMQALYSGASPTFSTCDCHTNT